ncbi:hypothetical protein VDGD_08531 [Verticillium dahliae]|nr:hypothetical protein VDGD_08531 [Verticillium dahliae]
MPSNNFIHAGGVGGGVVPQLDAPHSASNAGDRRVTIRCLQSSISLPVTPDTSPVDLLFSAANLMSHNIDPQSSIVVECYFSFGLERPLRRYERIRDVLNSWERDVQHSLLIIPGGAAEISSDLSIESVPRSHDAPPGFINFPMNLSHRPGRWNKRLITLLETGQVYSHKKPDAKLSDKDSTALCNLSDFDVYQVTDQDMLKRLKVPKKHVLAIKSQQKNSVFLNTENFIHFLSTDDTTAARKLHKSVQEWRSWYLVNKKVDLAKKEKALQTNHDRLHVEKPTDIVKSGHHRLKVSVDETPYTIGKFEPLLDMNRFDKPLEEFGKDFLPEKPAEKQRPPVQRTTARPTTATRQAIASPLQSPRAPVSPPQRIDPFAREDEFKSNGLLGKVYEDRKYHAELAERTSDDSPAEGPFTGGLLQNRLQEESRLQEPSRQARSLDRSNTKRRPSAPPERRFQLDATAEEPPLESPFTGGLLQTRLQEESRQARSLDRSNTRRRPTASERRYQPEASPEPAVPVAGPFTGGGLLQTRNQDPARQTRAPERANTLRGASAEQPTMPRQPGRARARTNPRPPTSDGASYGKLAEKPEPLLDLSNTPRVPDLPQAWRESHGRGVRVPHGAPLVSMATDSREQQYGHLGGSGLAALPPSMATTGLARRGTTKTTKSNPSAAAAAATTTTTTTTGGLERSATRARSGTRARSSTRVRSASTAAPAQRRAASHEQHQHQQPPVPPMPTKSPVVRPSRRRDDDEDVPLINFVERARGRDPMARGVEMRTRTGPLQG